MLTTIRILLLAAVFSFLGNFPLSASVETDRRLVPPLTWADSSETGLTAYPYNPYVPQDVWEELSPLFLPYDHPIRAELDHLFQKKRAIQSMKALKAAQFKDVQRQQWTHIVVARHPRFPGYFFKFYLDDQRYHRKQPEYHFWRLRITGAGIIRDFIEANNLQGIFKVPKKWIYPLPAEPSPPEGNVRKNFILVEEDMDIYDEEENHLQWRSDSVTKEKLLTFCVLVSNLGLNDCAKPKNAPFSRDGRIAFIDTQTYYHWPIRYEKLTPFLSLEMKVYWTELTGK